MTGEPKNDKLFNPAYILLIIVVASISFSFNVVASTITSYATSVGLALSAAGVMAGIFSFAALFGRPLSGVCSDRFSKKRVAAIAAVVMALSVFGYGIMPSPAMLFAFRFLHGFAFAFCTTSEFAMAPFCIPKNKIGSGMGYLGMGQVLAGAVGPLISISLVDTIGYRAVYTADSIFLLAIASLILFLPDDKALSAADPDRPGNVPRAKRDTHTFLNTLWAKECTGICIFAGLLSVTAGITTSYIKSLGEARGIAGVGAFFTMQSIFILIVRPFAGWLTDKKGAVFVYLPAFAFSTLAMVLLGGAYSLPMVLIAAPFMALGNGCGQPALQAESVRRVNQARTGVAIATYCLGTDIGQGIGPMIGGVISERAGYGVMFASAAALQLAALIIGLLMIRPLKKSGK